MDTHSVNLSKDVEEVLALFQVQMVPISAGTPQELAFAETRVKMIRRMSTAAYVNRSSSSRQKVLGLIGSKCRYGSGFLTSIDEKESELILHEDWKANRLGSSYAESFWSTFIVCTY